MFKILLRGPDKWHQRAGFGTRAVLCPPLGYSNVTIITNIFSWSRGVRLSSANSSIFDHNLFFSNNQNRESARKDDSVKLFQKPEVCRRKNLGRTFARTSNNERPLTSLNNILHRLQPDKIDSSNTKSPGPSNRA